VGPIVYSVHTAIAHNVDTQNAKKKNIVRTQGKCKQREKV